VIFFSSNYDKETGTRIETKTLKTHGFEINDQYTTEMIMNQNVKL